MICSERFAKEHVMAQDKYTSIILSQLETIVYIYPSQYFLHRAGRSDQKTFPFYMECWLSCDLRQGSWANVLESFSERRAERFHLCNYFHDFDHTVLKA